MDSQKTAITHAPEQQDIRCEDTAKLLARISEQGIYLLCKECRCSHLFTWQWIEQQRERARPIHT